MAEDTAALLIHLGISNADLMGWSDGGQLALRLASTHPELVRRVVASGVAFGATVEDETQLGPQKEFAKVAARMFPKGREEITTESPRTDPVTGPVFAEKAWVIG